MRTLKQIRILLENESSSQTVIYEETIVENIFNVNYQDALDVLIKLIKKNKESTGSKFSIEYLADKAARQFKNVKTPKLIKMYNNKQK